METLTTTEEERVWFLWACTITYEFDPRTWHRQQRDFVRKLSRRRTHPHTCIDGLQCLGHKVTSDNFFYKCDYSWRNKSAFSFTSADNVTLLAFAAERCAALAPVGRRNRSISPARRTHSSKPAAAPCSTDWRTDGRTQYRNIDPVTYYASSDQTFLSIHLFKERNKTGFNFSLL